MTARCPLPPGSRVAAYCRASPGVDQERSVEQQEAVLREYCRRHNLALVRLFVDDDVSGGSTAGRDAFRDMIAWLRSLAPEPEAGKARSPDAPDAVLYWDLRRFGRNQDDSAFYRADLRRRGYELISLADDIPAGDLAPVFEAILGWKAAQDLADIRRDVRRGQRDLLLTRAEGTQLGDGGYLNVWWSPPPAGFRAEPVQVGVHRDGRPRVTRRLVPDRGGAWERVRLAFEMRACGASYAEVHRATRLHRSRTGYYAMFHRRLYLGVLEYGDPKQGGLVVEDWIEPCVDAATWAAVQARHGQWGGDPVSDYTLSALLSCGECGSAMCGTSTTTERGPGGELTRYRYYHCTRRGDVGECYTSRMVHAAGLERAVYVAVRDDVLTPAALYAMLEGVRPGEEERDRAAAEEERAGGRRDEAGRALRRLVALAERAGSQVDALAERIVELEAERRIAEGELAEARRRLAAAGGEEVPDVVLRAFCADAAATLEAGDPEAVRGLLGAVVRKITAWPDGRAVVEYKAPPVLGGGTGDAGGRDVRWK